MRCGVLECLQKDLLEIHTNSAVLLLMKLIKKESRRDPPTGIIHYIHRAGKRTDLLCHVAEFLFAFAGEYQ